MLTKSSYPEREEPKVLVELSQPELIIIVDALYYYAVFNEFMNTQKLEQCAEAIDLADGFQTMIDRMVLEHGEL